MAARAEPVDIQTASSTPITPQPPKPWYGPFRQLSNGALELLCHSIMVALILAAIRGVEYIIRFFWGTSEKMLFDRLPVRYLFDGADLLLLLVFLLVGVPKVLRAYVGK